MLVTVEIMHCQDSKTGWNESPAQRELNITNILHMVRAVSDGLHSNLHNFKRFSKFVKKPLFVLICHNYTEIKLSSACLCQNGASGCSIYSDSKFFKWLKKFWSRSQSASTNHEVTPFTFTFYFNCYVAALLQNIGSNVNFKNIISTQICSPATLHNVWLYLRQC